MRCKRFAPHRDTRAATPAAWWIQGATHPLLERRLGILLEGMDGEIRAVLTPEQQQVFDRNRQGLRRTRPPADGG
jgi:hypothetical protein